MFFNDLDTHNRIRIKVGKSEDNAIFNIRTFKSFNYQL